MITVTGLTKHYGDRTAVDDLTFTVAAGRVTGFVGPNGAGKSTTMRMMVGLTRPDRGEVRYDGVRYTDLRHPARLVGTVLDPRCMHPGHTARNHLRAMAATQRHPRRPGRRGPGRGRPRVGRGPAHRRLLPRHAPAPRPGRRPARRPAGPAARRAVERPRPRRHPLAPQPPHRLRPPRRLGVRVEPPHRRARHVRRRPRRRRRRPAPRRRDRRGDHRPAGRDRRRRDAPARRPRPGAGRPGSSPSRPPATGWSSAAPPRPTVSQLAFEHGIRLVELSEIAPSLEDTLLDMTGASAEFASA